MRGSVAAGILLVLSENKDECFYRSMIGIVRELESMSLREPDHPAIGSQDFGEHPIETEFCCTFDQM